MDIYSFASNLGFDIKELNIVKIGKNYYLAGEDLKEVRSKINRDVFALGIYLGEEGKYFAPSPGFIEILSKLPNARKVFINNKAEGLFLYGRNILKDSIIRNTEKIETGYVFVQNERDENLGYGIFHMQEKELVLKNLLDKGFYLRKERR